MIRRLVALALGAWGRVLLAAGLIVVGGLYAFKNLNVEAYPNPVPPMVEVIAQPMGWTAEEVERYITIPLEVGLAGMPGLEHTRSQSLFQLADVKCYFKWGTNYWAARQEVINRLQLITLPNGVQAQLSPANAIGEVFRYTLRGKGYSLKDLKSAEDWILERQFRRVEGVIDVTGFGGEVKEYHVEVDPVRMRGRGVTLDQLTAALANSNINIGGNRLPMGEQSFDVRSIGIIRSITDIGDVVVAVQNKTPIHVRDIATVEIGHQPRLGLAAKNGGCPLRLETRSGWDRFWESKQEREERDRLDNPPGLDGCVPNEVEDRPEVVLGIILMRYGAETGPVLDGIYKRIELIRKYHLLPPGMEIEPFYVRANLVKLTTHTVLENLVVGMALVIAILLLFLGNTRAALITALNIPLALLIAFIGLVATGTSANLISLGAVDFGIVVDSTVIMMENIFRHLGHGAGRIRERIMTAASEIGGPMLFSTLIIGVAFLPLFTMSGVSGVIFAPMAVTYAWAIGGAILLALTLTPVLASKLMKVGAEEKEGRLMSALQKVYNPLSEYALRHTKWAVAFFFLPIALCVALFPLLGREFMPQLEEGNFWIRITLPMSISMEQSAKYATPLRAILRGRPEVEGVISQVGRPDDGTDVTGFYNIELYAPLKPFAEWPTHLTKVQLTEILREQFAEALPGADINFSQYISDNVQEAVAGVKGENSVKVDGPDLKVNETKAQEIVDAMSGIRGIADLGMLRTLGQPSIKIVADRTACARYGLNSGDIGEIVDAAIGGHVVTNVYEGEKLFALTVRWQEPYRKSLDEIRQITVSAPDGTQIALGQLATITKADGPAITYREDGWRFTPVKFSVRGRDLAGAVGEAQQVVAQKVKLPYDTHLEWAGEINEMHQAADRLMLIIPLTLLLITFLTFSAVKNWLDTIIVLINIPAACTGGVIALAIARQNLSVSAAMGFISIFGIAIQDAILVVTYFQRLRAGGRTLEQAAREAAEKRFRPALMTTLVATLGLLPAALSNGIGSQTQKPLAIVVIGGSLILALTTRVLRPPILLVAHRWHEGRRMRHIEAAGIEPQDET